MTIKTQNRGREIVLQVQARMVDALVLYDMMEIYGMFLMNCRIKNNTIQNTRTLKSTKTRKKG